MKYHNVLIVGTQPYNEMVQSRAFDSYFYGWPKNKLAQVFSDPRIPVKGNCESLYQITDKRLIKARFNRADPGLIFGFNDLNSSWSTAESSHKSPRRKTALLKLLRKALWNKKYWQTKQFCNWLDTFAPEAVFISFSRDFFIFDLAFFIADRFNIPIIASTADDYVFDGHFSLNPFYWAYRSLYKKTINKLLRKKAYWIFESPKIQEKYVSEFHVNSQIQYIGTDLEGALSPKPSKEIKTINYFGNLEYGRFNSICDIADAIYCANQRLLVDIYSKDSGNISKRLLVKHPNIRAHDQVPYNEVEDLSEKSDLLLIVEGFKKSDVRAVRYSLSTKVADSLKSGHFVLAYGDKDAGAIDFLAENKCALVATSKKELAIIIAGLLKNPNQYKDCIDRGLKTVMRCFSIKNGSATFKLFVNDLVNTK